MVSKPTFFSNQNLFREWLRDHHKTEKELWVGYYKKASDLPSLTWSESVDQALCYGWIDGLRKSIDDKSYKIRFTPRKPNSNWSAINLEKVAELKKKRLMRASGLAAFEKRKKECSSVYGYEIEGLKLAESLESRFKQNQRAWNYFQNSAPGYKKQVIRWIMSAKREDTQTRRLQLVIKHSAAREKIPQYEWKEQGSG